MTHPPKSKKPNKTVKPPRIIAGDLKGRRLVVPRKATVRPATDRTRESVFNILMTAEWARHDNGPPLIKMSNALDLFAGSGSYGFEAISRGAQYCTFVDNNPFVIKSLEENAKNLEVTFHTNILQRDVLKIEKSDVKSPQIIFCDPPYQTDLIDPVITHLKEIGLIAPKTLLVLEQHKKEADPTTCEIIDQRTYGISRVTFAHCPSAK